MIPADSKLCEDHYVTQSMLKFVVNCMTERMSTTLGYTGQPWGHYSTAAITMGTVEEEDLPARTITVSLYKDHLCKSGGKEALLFSFAPRSLRLAAAFRATKFIHHAGFPHARPRLGCTARRPKHVDGVCGHSYGTPLDSHRLWGRTCDSESLRERPSTPFARRIMFRRGFCASRDSHYTVTEQVLLTYYTQAVQG